MSSILVVEDDVSTQRLLTRQLEGAGHKVTVAENGLAALMVLERQKPDLIICDMNMPKLGGLDFVRALKSREETRSLPIIFLTSNNDPGLMIDGINVGARYYLTKPYDPHELLWKIQRVIDPKAQRPRNRTPDPRRG
jgi:CheY-like chemotaxis protein